MDSPHAGQNRRTNSKTTSRQPGPLSSIPQHWATEEKPYGSKQTGITVSLIQIAWISLMQGRNQTSKKPTEAYPHLKGTMLPQSQTKNTNSRTAPEIGSYWQSSNSIQGITSKKAEKNTRSPGEHVSSKLNKKTGLQSTWSSMAPTQQQNNKTKGS